MDTIIATTDFSEVSGNAVKYACSFAKDINADVIVLHSFIVPVTFSDTPMPMIPVDESRQIAEERMNTLSEELKQQYPGIRFTFKIMYGDIIDCLKEITENKAAPILVVMGNNTDDELPLWMGSNLLSALKNLSFSVIGIPAEVGYQKIANICIACDANHIREDLPVQTLIKFIQTTGAKLHVLHIDANEDADDAKNELIALHESLAALEPEFHYQNDSDIDKGISEFVETHNMDWLIVMPHKHSLLEGLFHKSHTKAMMRKMHIPIIAMHNQ